MSSTTRILLLSLFSPFVAVLGAPAIGADAFLQNGFSAQQLNAQFASIKKTDSCQGKAVTFYFRLTVGLTVVRLGNGLR